MEGSPLIFFFLRKDLRPSSMGSQSVKNTPQRILSPDTPGASMLRPRKRTLLLERLIPVELSQTAAPETQPPSISRMTASSCFAIGKLDLTKLVKCYIFNAPANYHQRAGNFPYGPIYSLAFYRPSFPRKFCKSLLPAGGLPSHILLPADLLFAIYNADLLTRTGSFTISLISARLFQRIQTAS